MNIFYLSDDPEECARYHCDSHVVKMILENAQMLSTAHHLLDGYKPGLYKTTHKNHPSNLWVRSSEQNYMWLYYLFQTLSYEYTFRYGKIHKTTSTLLNVLNIPPSNIPNVNFSEPPQCMPDKYRVKGNSIEAYRKYYREDKKHLHSWKKRDKPEWL